MHLMAAFSAAEGQKHPRISILLECLHVTMLKHPLVCTQIYIQTLKMPANWNQM